MENSRSGYMVKETAQKEKTVHTHRVGSMTFGLVLILFGILFLVHMLWPGLSYIAIFRLWPCILILLGMEVLISNRQQTNFTYDRGAVVLLIVLTFFAMSMAGMDWIFEHAAHAAYYQW